MADVDLPDDLNLDILLEGIDDPSFIYNIESLLSDPVPDSGSVVNPIEPVNGSPAFSDESTNSLPPWAKLEEFLLGDDVELGSEDGFDAEFFAGVFGDGAKECGETRKGEETKNEVLRDGAESEETGNVEETINDEDTASKKRRRQLRNRDSAMKSRERRKLYVNELEMKSKYLEMECRRLDQALRCCVAENMALRQHLQKERAPGALGAKQESAVLFMESLLLGSLFWLVSIVSLFLVPSLCDLNRMVVSRPGSGPALGIIEVVGPANKNCDTHPPYGSIMMRKYRGMRSRMKINIVRSLNVAYT